MSNSRPVMSTVNIQSALKKNEEEDKKLAEAKEKITYKDVKLKNSEIKSEQIVSTHFTYEILSKELNIQKGSYKGGIHIDNGYISLSLRNLRKGQEPVRDYGLKIHISLDDTIDGNIAKGWNAIVGILKYYHVARTKVVSERIPKDDPLEESVKCGKQITIYACVNSEGSNWQNVLSAITDALLKNNVAPGYRPHPDSSKAVKNNCYLSYRYDLDVDSIRATYRPSSTRGAFPDGVDDPLINLNIPTPGYEPKSIPSLDKQALFQQDVDLSPNTNIVEDHRSSSTSAVRRKGPN